MGNKTQKEFHSNNSWALFVSAFSDIEVVESFSAEEIEKHLQEIKSETQYLYLNEYISSKVKPKKKSIKIKDKNYALLTPKSFPSQSIFPILFALSDNKLLPVLWLKKTKSNLLLVSGLTFELIEDKNSLNEIIKSAIYVSKNFVFAERNGFKNINTLPFVIKTKDISFTSVKPNKINLLSFKKRNIYSKNDFGEAFLYRGKLYFKFPPYLAVSDFEVETDNKFEYSSKDNIIYGAEKGESIPKLFILPSNKKPVFDISYQGEKPIEIKFSIPLRKITPHFYEQTGLNYFVDKNLKLIYVSTADKDVSVIIVSSTEPISLNCNIEKKNIRVSVRAKFPPKTSFKLVFIGGNKRKKFLTLFKNTKKESKRNPELLSSSTVLDSLDRKDLNISYSEGFVKLYTPEAKEKLSASGFTILEMKTVLDAMRSFVWGNEKKKIEKVAKTLSKTTIGEKLFPSGVSFIEWEKKVSAENFLLEELKAKEEKSKITSVGKFLENRLRDYYIYNFLGKDKLYHLTMSLKALYLEILGLREANDELLLFPIIPCFIKTLSIKKIYTSYGVVNFTYKKGKKEFTFKIKKNFKNKIKFFPLISPAIRNFYEIDNNDFSLKIPKTNMFFIYSIKEDLSEYLDNGEYLNEKKRLKIKLKENTITPLQFEMELFDLSIKKIVGARTSAITKDKRLIFVDPKRNGYFYIYFGDVKDQNLLFKGSKKTNNSY